MNYLPTSLDFSNILKFLQIHKTQVFFAASVVGVLYLAKRFYFAGGYCKSKARLDGKTAIVTGANTGIGKETAFDFAKRGARVILACRDVKKAILAAEQIRRKSGNGNVVVEYLNLASFESIKRFAQKMNTQEERIDILVNNAAVMACPPSKTDDGFEMQFGVNHLGHFLLTTLLLDKIKKSAPARIVNVSALAHEWTKMKWDDLNSEKKYDPWDVYSRTKLENVLFTRELAKRLKGTGVTTYALHPGIVRTELGRNFFKTYGWLYAIAAIIMIPLRLLAFKSAKEGVQTTIYCAVSEDVKDQSGLYYSDCKIKPLKSHASNDEDAARLWEISENMIKSKS